MKIEILDLHEHTQNLIKAIEDGQRRTENTLNKIAQDTNATIKEVLPKEDRNAHSDSKLLDELFKRLANVETKTAKLYEALITLTPNGKERPSELAKRNPTILEALRK